MERGRKHGPRVRSARPPLHVRGLLGLEREGCAVVDRAMTHPADLALSASACCAVWTEEALKVRQHYA